VLLLFVDVHFAVGAATTWIMHAALIAYMQRITFGSVGVNVKPDLDNILNLMLTSTSVLTSTSMLTISLGLMIRAELTSSFR